MKVRILALVVAVSLSAVWVVAQEVLPGGGKPAAPAEEPPTDARHYSYAIGLDVGTNFRGDKLELDVDSLLAGLKDGLEGKDPQYAQELCQLSLQRLSQQKLEAIQVKNKEFLVENAKAQGVQTTPSGLQYKVIKTGQGATPTAQDSVTVHYSGKLVDGTVFDESYGGDPVTFGVGQVIPGWTEALQLMKAGDKWEVVIPSDLGYGPRGAGDVIPPNSTLIFEVELLGVKGK